MAIPSLEAKIKNFTEDPGVYLMKGDGDEVLYIGKAKNLKNRISSYFQKQTTNRSPRIELLIKTIRNVEVIITDTEVEALVLECNLIKKYHPRFNVQLKDDKSYPYVRIHTAHTFPRLEYVRKAKKDGARYFGPFVSAYQIKDVLRWAQKEFKLRDCSDSEFRNRIRPCILYEMKQCSAPCVGLIDNKNYFKNIEQVLKILEGKTKEVVNELKTQMENASENLNFELAAEMRDRIQHLEALNSEQKITQVESTANQDIVQLARQGSKAVVVLLAIREGKTIGVFQYPFEDLDEGLQDEELLFEFLIQYYLPRYEQSPQILPTQVFLPFKVKQTFLLEKALKQVLKFSIPSETNPSDLLKMVKKTAEFHLSELCLKSTQKSLDLLDVQKKLHLKNLPRRLECYDISHFQGEGTVGSRVVFIEGTPEKKLYRHYHIKDVTGVDDFKSLKEVLWRRFKPKHLRPEDLQPERLQEVNVIKRPERLQEVNVIKRDVNVKKHNDNAIPDLIVLDGGKAQLAQAQSIFKELEILGVEYVALAKARTKRAFQDSEIQSSLERIFKPNQRNPIFLKPQTGAYRILTQARDESHRFAITFHRQIRDKKRIQGKK